jgi:hypothetical protein
MVDEEVPRSLCFPVGGFSLPLTIGAAPDSVGLHDRTGHHMYELSEGELSFESWVAKYRPLKNHITKHPDTSADFDQFETYGEEWEFIKTRDPYYVWTYLDGDASSLLVQGIAYVNRISYYVCEVPWTDGTDEIVVISVDNECMCFDSSREDEDGEYGAADCDLCGGSGYATEYVD